MRRWFEGRFGAPSPVQARGWPRIAAGEHALLVAPTGSGKTLAAFLFAIDRLLREPPAEAGVRVVYVSPLKALAADIERNLRGPLAEVAAAAAARGVALRLPRVALRTGDTPARERRVQARDPAEILVTTPESLYLILGSRQRETLARVETVIVDEIHALAPSKRGAHLALSLERLAAAAVRDPQRIGLSATARPVAEVAAFLGGDRPVATVEVEELPRLELSVRMPAAEPGATQGGDAPGPWAAIVPALLAEIRAHRSTLVFTNSRGLCERLARQLNERAGEELVRAHHGSVSHEERRAIEAALAAGTLPALVATHSLELGIDMEAVDCVLCVESPGSVARGLQRVGRAGHRLGAASRGRFYPLHPGDLVESVAVVRGMRSGAVEPLRVPGQPLDVLAQQIVAICSAGPVGVAELEALLRRTRSYRELSREALSGVLDMLSGRYPSTDFAALRARIRWDRHRDRLEALPGSALLAIVSGGTIPDRGLYAVHRGEGGPRVGELDEEMVHETRPGDVVTLGASSWRVETITRDRVIVAPAPGEPGRLPFWRGEGPGRPLALGRALGATLRELAERCDAGDGDLEAGRARGEAWLREALHCDAAAARALVDHVVAQQRATGSLPSDRALTVERFRDEVGDWRICILSPFGARLHAPWALAIESRLGGGVQAQWSDDGISLRWPDAEGDAAAVPLDALLPDPACVEDEVVAALGRSALFAGQFRENAARALLLPRRRPGSRTPLWSQRLRAQGLLAVAAEYPAFPIVLETYRSCLQDVFDVPALAELLGAIRSGALRVHEAETARPSPFARSLVFEYTAAYLYQGDAPAADRRARALTLDRAMLRDLLGGDALRGLLDVQSLEALERELAGLAGDARVRGRDALHDLLRRLGELEPEELAARCVGDAAAWSAELASQGRAARIALADRPCWIAAEDAGLYRDAFGATPPAGLPDAFLAPVARPLEQWALRFAAGRGPFTAADAAARCGLAPAAVEAALAALVARGRLEAGEFDPRRPPGTREWCHPEVLRRARQRSLAALRAEVSAVEGPAFARFLVEWHGVGDGRRGEARLREALERLEGFPVSVAELERSLLPARVADYDPRMLDALGALGEWVWIGCGALGTRDGRVRLFRRDRAALLAEPGAPDAPLGPLARKLLEHLEQRGASFAGELVGALGAAGVADLFGALRELAWAGLVTNDHFGALRALAAGRPPRVARRSQRRPGDPRSQPLGARAGDPRSQPLGAGRWSAVSRLGEGGADPTRRAHARALLVLERFGVASREGAALDEVAGGFAALLPVYREMERAGRLRGGHFVEPLGGAQFAFAGAVDRLRAARDAPARRGGPVARLLAATDPANPYGALLPWPAPAAGGASPRRATGASVVLADGALALALEAGGRRLQTFGLVGAPLEAAIAALRGWRRGARRGALRIEEIDGQPAQDSPLERSFTACGFRRDYRALVWEPSSAVRDVI